jgi:hypothetical protein
MSLLLPGQSWSEVVNVSVPVAKHRNGMAQPKGCSGWVTSMSYWNGDSSNILAEAPRTRRLKASHPHDYVGRTFKGDAIA